MSKILFYFLEYIYTLLANNLIKQNAPFVGIYALSINGDFNFKLTGNWYFPEFYFNWEQSVLGLHLLQSL